MPDPEDDALDTYLQILFPVLDDDLVIEAQCGPVSQFAHESLLLADAQATGLQLNLSRDFNNFMEPANFIMSQGEIIVNLTKGKITLSRSALKDLPPNVPFEITHVGTALLLSLAAGFVSDLTASGDQIVTFVAVNAKCDAQSALATTVVPAGTEQLYTLEEFKSLLTQFTPGCTLDRIDPVAQTVQKGHSFPVTIYFNPPAPAGAQVTFTCDPPGVIEDLDKASGRLGHTTPFETCVLRIAANTMEPSVRLIVTCEDGSQVHDDITITA